MAKRDDNRLVCILWQRLDAVIDEYRHTQRKASCGLLLAFLACSLAELKSLQSQRNASGHTRSDFIFAARVSSRLIDLGIDVKKLDKFEPDLALILCELERDKRKVMNPHEVAAQFFTISFSHIPENCYLQPIPRPEMAKRAWGVMLEWADKGKMRSEWFHIMQKTLREQQEF